MRQECGLECNESNNQVVVSCNEVSSEVTWTLVPSPSLRKICYF